MIRTTCKGCTWLTWISDNLPINSKRSRSRKRSCRWYSNNCIICCRSLGCSCIIIYIRNIRRNIFCHIYIIKKRIQSWLWFKYWTCKQNISRTTIWKNVCTDYTIPFRFLINPWSNFCSYTCSWLFFDGSSNSSFHNPSTSAWDKSSKWRISPLCYSHIFTTPECLPFIPDSIDGTSTISSYKTIVITFFVYNEVR